MATETAAPAVVHVAGQVVRPGIVRLAPGSRVIDAVEAAGGPLTEADLAAVNLARPVVDGEQVYVPKPGEAVPAVPGASTGTGPAAEGAPIDLNAADATALDGLPGVGPVLAERIIAWRTEHGRFTSVDELGEVSGIGEKLLGQIRDRVTVPP
ncbi:ComEA family DNA-binding protein [Nostocoides sp. F2B08]|nr:ComEA family DNA-binding protein [Tetrasphaera sp. F2B08]